MLITRMMVVTITRTKISRMMTMTRSMIMLQATTVSDLTTAKACLSDPSVSCICPTTIQAPFNSYWHKHQFPPSHDDCQDSSCTTTYSSTSALPSVLDLKCSTSTCSSIQTDIDSLETSVTALSEYNGD